MHAGRLKGGQPDKIASDILKMLLYDKVLGICHKKYIVVCDKDEYLQLHGNSSLAEAVRRFNVEVLFVEIGQEDHDRIISTMKKQDIRN